MNQSQIHPALRRTSNPSPPKPKNSHYAEGATSTYSPIQPSPTTSYHTVPNPGYYQSDPQQTHASPSEHSPSDNPVDPNDLKRPRACEACRQLKVRCEPDEASPTGSCKRCAKAHRQCVVTVPSRKRQKKTDSRVAELEKKIDALTATLAAKGGADVDTALDPAIAQQSHGPPRSSLYTDQWQPPHLHQHHSRSPPSPARTTGTKRKYLEGPEYFGNELPKIPPAAFKSPSPVPQFPAAYHEQRQRHEADEPPYVDVIDRNVIDAQTAYRCYDRYKTEMCNQLPIVVFPTDLAAEELRRNKPVLFLAVLAVGSSTISPELQPKLISEVSRILGDRIIYHGEKSMELVQTIQLMTVFYQPPERYEELNFNQMIHIAAVMAMDIGMGKRSKKVLYPIWKGYMEKNKGIPDPNSAETRRCWLGCYYMCTNSAMSLRRPQLIRWSLYADECVQTLTTAKDALPSDKWLCHFVKAQHIAENIGIEFSMDDPAQALSLTEQKTQRHLKVFRQNLAEWHNSGSEMMHSPIMKHTEAIVNLYMHEIAMHHDHNIDDFRPPYNTTPIEGPPDPDLVTPAHIESLTACLNSAHNAFEAFLSMDIRALRALPTHFFVRNSYAAVALIKLYSAVAAKGSKFGSILTKEELKVDAYLDRLIQTLQKVAEGNMSKVAHKFTLIFCMLRNWHLKRNETSPGDFGDRDGSLKPGSTKQENQDFKGQPHDTSQAWSKSSRSNSEQNSQSQPAHGSLRMLPDAAMDSGRPISAQTSQGQWLPQAQVGQLQSLPGMETMGMAAQDYNMMAAAYGAPNDPIAMGGFTSDDFMAFGLSVDWVNFGFNQNGVWAV